MKFRYPVPEAFSPRNAKYNDLKKDAMDIPTSSADSKAVLDSHSCLDSPIWISSTIPDGWIWLNSSQDDTLTDQVLPAMKRSSTSELEGDAVTDAILNLQFLSYTPLSQTCSKVKMIQSLMPIWEEFEFNGMHGHVIPPYHGKPLPKDVLRKLSNGIGFEDIFLDPTNSPTDEDDGIGEWEEKMNAYPCKSAEQLKISENVESSSGVKHFQVSDHDALGVLNWLASSQAAEDINSDDDLTRETILSPLMPATTIDKVLEKAHADYENESQQECVDILATVLDRANVEGLDGTLSYLVESIYPCKTSPSRMIPQVDGSSDGIGAVSCANKSSGTYSEPGTSSETDLLHNANFGMFSDHKKRRKMWGPLPVSSVQKVNDLSSTAGVSTISRCHIKDDSGLPCTTGCGINISPNIVKGSNRETVVKCSMRDLMRKKRCYRTEPPLCTSEMKKIPSVKEDREDSWFCIEKSYEEQNKTHLSYSMNRVSVGAQPRGCDETNTCPTSRVQFEPYDGNARNPANGKLPMHSSICNTFPRDSSNSELYHSLQGSDVHCVREANVALQKLLHGETDPSEQYSFSMTSMGAVQMEQCVPNDCEDIDICFHNTKSSNTNIVVSESVPCAQSLKFASENESSGGEKLLQRDANESSSHYTPIGGLPFKDGAPSCTEIDYMQRSDKTGVTVNKMHWVSTKSCEAMPAARGVTLSLSETLPSGCDGKNTDSFPHSHPSTTLVTESRTAPTQTVNLTYPESPLVMKCKHELGPCTRETLGIPQLHHEDKQNYDALCGQEIVSEELPPFFGRSSVEYHTTSRALDYNDCGQGLLGVPFHCQSDGSYLFMLTPVFTPPLAKCVEKWMTLDSADVSNENNDVCLTSSPSIKGSSWQVMPMQNSQALSNSHCLTAPASVSGLKPNMDLVNRQNNGSHNVETQFSHGESKRMQQSKGDPLKGKHSSDLAGDLSQISGPDRKSKLTPLSQIGFRDSASIGFGQQLTLLSIEVQAESRGDLRPDPRFDAISIVILVVCEDDDPVADAYVLLHCNGLSVPRNLDALSGCKVWDFCEEKHLFSKFVKIFSSIDPDVVMGWDIQGGSLGFLAERASHIGIDLLRKISRALSETHAPSKDYDEEKRSNLFSEPIIRDSVLCEDMMIIDDEWGRTHASGIHVGGRIVLNIWRLMRGEVKLNMYTIENVAEAVLRRKIPSIPGKVLTNWFLSGPGRARFRCIEYILERAKLNIQIIKRGPLVVQRKVGRYLTDGEHMEPQSGFYADPVVVLDFQSLYPSMIIAYNLCYSTCLGKITSSKTNILGVSSYSPGRNILQKIKDKILLTPNGVMFVPSDVRKGVLPRMLEELLETRIMVKQAMKKLDVSQKVLNRIFNARQLALKLISNVTYGYTAAGFSGRMPCAELADSIVQCGRRTLENAISFVNTNDKWKAKVIYGDTDSMFVLLKGCSLNDAFRIGNEIATEVSARNPHPVTLKMEKVKAYLVRQWTRIISGRVDLQDFVFSKEVRLGTYSVRSYSLPPAAIVATKAMRTDPRAEPRYAERVPYVVVHGEPGARLADLVVDPLDLLTIDSPHRINDTYYIQKQIIPALQRVFGLVGADLNQWFQGMPRPERGSVGKRGVFAPNAQRKRIDYYYLSKHCILCGDLVQGLAFLCHNCSKNESSIAVALTGRTSKLEMDMHRLVAICRHCGGGDWVLESGVKCTSLACSIFYERMKTMKELHSLSAAASEAGFYPSCTVEWF
ncbi:unnamed protein product [Cuscuta campestris]|uniref:DNA polymerase n=1 Tax=Cuscuta campestris TaxID=132261 RepID=A0A484ND81_9ASTE|nr:unnamed protein product [Cuscuta campestris]